MDLRKIKLDLTIALMNNPPASANVLQTTKQLMLGFKEVGAFSQFKLLRKSDLDKRHTQKTYALEFENCTLDVSMIANRKDNSQFIN
ncbi:MAG: hypothetical protein KDC44_20225, partial [Phaeodactylibacter sp.]|nr:hypothetical protein [Phaeodactylibacter sp.]